MCHLRPITIFVCISFIKNANDFKEFLLIQFRRKFCLRIGEKSIRMDATNLDLVSSRSKMGICMIKLKKNERLEKALKE